MRSFYQKGTNIPSLLGVFLSPSEINSLESQALEAGLLDANEKDLGVNVNVGVSPYSQEEECKIRCFPPDSSCLSAEQINL